MDIYFNIVNEHQPKLSIPTDEARKPLAPCPVQIFNLLGAHSPTDPPVITAFLPGKHLK